MTDSNGRVINYEDPICFKVISYSQVGGAGEGELILTWDQIVRVSEFMFPNAFPHDKRAKACIHCTDNADYIVLVDWEWLASAFGGYIAFRNKQKRLFFTPMN